MGEVFKARDTRLNRIVAIKLSQVRFSDRFENEARAVAALNQPHICTLYDIGPNYLIMEFVEGAPLKGPLPLEKAVEYAIQILDALEAAHQKGITHRDLKPANILVANQGIKLLDFGLAKQTAPLKETGATRTLTEKGPILGTLQFMSPEQLQGKEADAHSDLFSFGCVLYELLTGKRAFDGTSAASVIAPILEREPAPLDCPASLSGYAYSYGAVPSAPTGLDLSANLPGILSAGDGGMCCYSVCAARDRVVDRPLIKRPRTTKAAQADSLWRFQSPTKLRVLLFQSFEAFFPWLKRTADFLFRKARGDVLLEFQSEAATRITTTRSTIPS